MNWENHLTSMFSIHHFHDTYATERSFLGLQSVVNVFSCLLPQRMPSYTDDELFDAVTNLAKAYPDDLTQDSGP
jgi:hypothetical protein